MSNEQSGQLIQSIYEYLFVLQEYLIHLPLPHQKQSTELLEKTTIALDHLQLVLEEMQTSLQSLEETVEAIEVDAFLQQRQLTTEYQHYRDLFELSPNAYVMMKPNGVILQANQAAGKLLAVEQSDLVGMPFFHFVVGFEWQALRLRLNQLLSGSSLSGSSLSGSSLSGSSLSGSSLLSSSSQRLSDFIQNWEITLQTSLGRSFAGEVSIQVVDNRPDAQKVLMSMRDVSHYKQTAIGQQAIAPQLNLPTEAKPASFALPHSLEGLRVLVVDDEADAREFIIALLEAHGIGARAVASAAAALEELERFRPDVLLSDIRMPGGDGYSLIRQIRALEAQQGGHLPAAAITAYLEEDREKAIAAGFEAYLHKLAQPTDWVEIVAELAKQSSSRGQGL